MKDTATLLHEWRQLRIKLQENFTEDNLQDIIYRVLEPSFHIEFLEVYYNAQYWIDKVLK
mgnify:CR=1 FL=1